MLGPGKYDDLASALLRSTQAEGIILMVLDGARGSGMSCKLHPDLDAKLPLLLRTLAAMIEKEHREHRTQAKEN
jgi:hypothetical protein